MTHKEHRVGAAKFPQNCIDQIVRMGNSRTVYKNTNRERMFQA
jgi:hypothetical protein